VSRDIREATTEDVWAIHETARESWHAAYDDLLSPDRVDEIVNEWYAIGDIESSIAEATDRDDVAFLVAESIDPGPSQSGLGEQCSGFAHVVPWPENDRVGYLARLYVQPELWGEGVGTALLDTLERTVTSVFDRLRAAALADNDVGVSFYESNGFDRVDSYESDLGDELEEYVYEKQL